MNSSPDQSTKPRKAKSRQVSSRYLSPTSNNSHASIPSPNRSISPIRRKNVTTTTSTIVDTRKHKSTDHSHSPGSSIRGLWPSSGTTTITPNSSTEKFDTLADHLGNETLKYQKNSGTAADCNSISINRQRSCSEFNRFGNERNERGSSTIISSKENDRPIIGGSMRYGGRFSKSSSPSIGTSQIPPKRLSVDDNTLNRRKSDSFIDSFETGSESSETCSNAADSSLHTWAKMGNVNKKFTIKNAIKRANLLTRYGSSTSQWALAPGRSSTSSPGSVESKGKSTSFSNLKPPSSPSSRTNGVEKLFNMGLELFKSKKSSHSNNSENVHQLRLLHNRFIQWRFVNARSVVANDRIDKEAEINMINASNSIVNLRQSVQQKRLQLQKEKLEATLNFILRSQVKPLEAWGDMERQHSLALLKTRDSLHSVVCRVPLIEGAKVDTQSASIALRHASDLFDSIQSMLTTFSPEAEKIVELMSELAEVVAQEKCGLDECVELLSTLPTREIEELSLKCHIIQKHH